MPNLQSDVVNIIFNTISTPFLLFESCYTPPAGSQLVMIGIQVIWLWKLLAAAFMWRHDRAWPKSSWKRQNLKHPGFFSGEPDLLLGLTVNTTKFKGRFWSPRSLPCFSARACPAGAFVVPGIPLAASTTWNAALVGLMGYMPKNLGYVENLIFKSRHIFIWKVRKKGVALW